MSRRAKSALIRRLLAPCHKSQKMAKALHKQHPEGRRHPAREMMRQLPSRRELS
ncbi:MAG: hypothetical protein JXR29_02440 [Methylothermaceae bacterium]|nr:hypothetical protein [Methylothermaceae bacterium]